MRMRTLGGTGIKVSPYCLGAMMFGAWDAGSASVTTAPPVSDAYCMVAALMS